MDAPTAMAVMRPSVELVQATSFFARRNPQSHLALVMILDSMPQRSNALLCQGEFILALDLRLSIFVFSNETKSTKSGWSSSSPQSTL